MKCSNRIIGTLLVLGIVITTGCVRQLSSPSKLEQQQKPFVPATLAPTLPPPTETPVPVVPAAEATPTSCVDALSFVADVTIPDGTVVSPGSTMDKRWEVKNTGTCNWNEKYTLRFISGDQMGAEPEQALYPALSGSQAVIRIMFTAPNEPGTYRSAWQAYNPAGQPFGDPFYIEIIVEAPTP